MEQIENNQESSNQERNQQIEKQLQKAFLFCIQAVRFPEFFNGLSNFLTQLAQLTNRAISNIPKNSQNQKAEDLQKITKVFAKMVGKLSKKKKIERIFDYSVEEIRFIALHAITTQLLEKIEKYQETQKNLE